MEAYAEQERAREMEKVLLQQRQQLAAAQAAQTCALATATHTLTHLPTARFVPMLWTNVTLDFIGIAPTYRTTLHHLASRSFSVLCADERVALVCLLACVSSAPRRNSLGAIAGRILRV